jgi:hypothetical protein
MDKLAPREKRFRQKRRERHDDADNSASKEDKQSRGTTAFCNRFRKHVEDDARPRHAAAVRRGAIALGGRP